MNVNLLNNDVGKFGKWFYKTVKMTIVGFVILITLIIISITLFNEKIIAIIRAF